MSRFAMTIASGQTAFDLVILAVDAFAEWKDSSQARPSRAKYVLSVALRPHSVAMRPWEIS